jgi:hypothetical protein
MRQLQFGNTGNLSRARYYGVELKAQKVRACKLSALMSGSRDVSIPARWVGLEFDLSSKGRPCELLAGVDTRAPWIWWL